MKLFCIHHYHIDKITEEHVDCAKATDTVYYWVCCWCKKQVTRRAKQDPNET